ncbi:MAG: hydrogen peroxide-inducible s activator [Pseudomonadota bacterium]|jgi:LysR family hydrogen peroxide-inducible transcriptional activator
MTLTELKYIVAVARERHFGRAAEACHVSQPTLSVAIRKLEDELGVTLFERGGVEVSVTEIGRRIVGQAQRVLDETATIREIAEQGRDPLAGALRVGVVHTIGPYLLPRMMRRVIDDAPQMPLLLHEQVTARLLELLRQGDIDVAILAEPFADQGFATCALYDEPFVVAVPLGHAWARRREIAPLEMKRQTMLMLGTGHCFRDHVLEVCPELSRFSQESTGIQKTFEGSSLETIRHMVATGIGITVLPWLAQPPQVLDGRARDDGLIAYVPFEPPAPRRRVVLAWRRSFTRAAAVEAVRDAILRAGLPGVVLLEADGTPRSATDAPSAAAAPTDPTRSESGAAAEAMPPPRAVPRADPAAAR